MRQPSNITNFTKLAEGSGSERESAASNQDMDGSYKQHHSDNTDWLRTTADNMNHRQEVSSTSKEAEHIHNASTQEVKKFSAAERWRRLSEPASIDPVRRLNHGPLTCHRAIESRQGDAAAIRTQCIRRSPSSRPGLVQERIVGQKRSPWMPSIRARLFKHAVSRSPSNPGTSTMAIVLLNRKPLPSKCTATGGERRRTYVVAGRGRHHRWPSV
ncbi:hypothetical protein CKAH01_09319 [Colletotrichum kahawae]|uniref:Uncharacterized protein n=1 Tax=Colletotrichum kahawae TaxID=34407 RepID=A0AAD9Y1G3_COLKA|nr:hypothetical protein CKAH01_09319 [Colletotrichum kahawae]